MINKTGKRGRPRGSRISCQCLQCGINFKTLPCYIKKGGGKFCSRSCSATYRNLYNNPAKSIGARKKISKNHANVSGESNPMYGMTGALAPGYIDGRSEYSGEVYRRKMLAQNPFPSCVACGESCLEKLHVHHADGNRGNNGIENLKWVCSKCHYSVAHHYIRDEKGRFASAILLEVV